MIPYFSSIKNPGKISVIYQITEPNQEIFVSQKFEVNYLKCYVQSFENIIEGDEYYCEVKTVDSYKGQYSNVTTDNLLMETFILPLRPYKEEILEIILFHNEKKVNLNFQKKLKGLDIL